MTTVLWYSAHLGALGLAVMGYHYALEAHWTELADMVLRLWCGFLVACLLITWTALHFKHLRETWIDPSLMSQCIEYGKKHLSGGRIIPNEAVLVFSLYIGVAYFAASAQRYDIALVVMAGLGLLVMALQEFRKMSEQ